jgi:WD40 repeat protein
VREVETGQEAHRCTGHTQGAWGAAFSLDGLRAVNCGEDGTVRLWGLPR